MGMSCKDVRVYIYNLIHIISHIYIYIKLYAYIIYIYYAYIMHIHVLHRWTCDLLWFWVTMTLTCWHIDRRKHIKDGYWYVSILALKVYVKTLLFCSQATLMVGSNGCPWFKSYYRHWSMMPMPTYQSVSTCAMVKTLYMVSGLPSIITVIGNTIWCCAY